MFKGYGASFEHFSYCRACFYIAKGYGTEPRVVVFDFAVGVPPILEQSSFLQIHLHGIRVAVTLSRHSSLSFHHIVLSCSTSLTCRVLLLSTVTRPQIYDRVLQGACFGQGVPLEAISFPQWGHSMPRLKPFLKAKIMCGGGIGNRFWIVRVFVGCSDLQFFVVGRANA